MDGTKTSPKILKGLSRQKIVHHAKDFGITFSKKSKEDVLSAVLKYPRWNTHDAPMKDLLSELNHSTVCVKGCRSKLHFFIFFTRRNFQPLTRTTKRCHTYVVP